MKPTSPHPRRVLLVRNDRLGDMVLTLPAFKAVRRLWPHSHLSALVPPYTAPLLAGTNLVDDVLLDSQTDSARVLGARLKQKKFDVAFVFNTNTRNAQAVWWAGIPQRVCWAYKPAGAIFGNRRVFVHRSHPPLHEAEFALEFVRRVGARCELSSLLPHLQVDIEARHRVRTRIARDLGTAGPLFGVHPFNGRSAYNWPPDKYAELISRLTDNGRVMITGTPAENEELIALRRQLTPRARAQVIVYTDFSLNDLMAALAVQTSLTVSSTGPMHVAAAVGTPVVALFSPHPAHAPAKWGPLGYDHTVLVPPLSAAEDARIPAERSDEVMSRINVDDVVTANLRYAGVTPARPHPADQAA